MTCRLKTLCRAIIFMGLFIFSLEHCQTESNYMYECYNRYYNNQCDNYRYGHHQVLECNLYEDLSLLNHHSLESYLAIYDSNLYEIKPASFRYFQNLHGLSMPGNNIAVLEPGSFNGLTNLEHLNLSYNNIEKISNGIFNGMYKLIALDLSHNKINTIEKTSFSGTDDLRILSLNNNEIVNMSWLAGHCKMLSFLDISNNRIEGLEFAKSCPKLTTLIVTNNNLTVFSGDVLSSSIMYLDLSKNSLDNIDDNSFRNLPNLTDLNLSYNQLFEDNEMPVNLFHSVQMLKVLNLSTTSIRKLRVGTFTQLQELQVLDLSSNHLTYLPNGIFHDLSKLTELYISDNFLSYFEYNDLSTRPMLDLNNNLWNCDSLSAIIINLGRQTVIRGNTYNTTNIFGIACYEEVRDFKKLDTYNTSNFNSLQKEYLAHIIQTQLDMRDVFAQLKRFLNQTLNKTNSSENAWHKEYLLDIERTLNETNLNLDGYHTSALAQQSNMYDILTKTFRVLQSMQNATITTEVPGERENTKQITEMYISQLTKLQKNYSVDSWKNFYKMQTDLRQTLNDIKDNFVNVLSNTQSQTPIKQTQAEALKTCETSLTNKSDTAALYCIVVLLLILVIIVLLPLAQFRRRNILKRDCEENPLNQLSM